MYLENGKDNFKSGMGRIKKKDGLKILFLKGSHYEMGYQHGTLLNSECKQNLRATLKLANKQKLNLNQLKKTWMQMKRFVEKSKKHHLSLLIFLLIILMHYMNLE